MSILPIMNRFKKYKRLYNVAKKIELWSHQKMQLKSISKWKYEYRLRANHNYVNRRSNYWKLRSSVIKWKCYVMNRHIHYTKNKEGVMLQTKRVFRKWRREYAFKIQCVTSRLHIRKRTLSMYLTMWRVYSRYRLQKHYRIKKIKSGLQRLQHTPTMVSEIII